MTKNRSKKIIVLSFFLTLIALSAVTASATPPPPADLQVQLQGPSSAFVRSPYIYTVNVKNTSGTTASGVNVTVEFPLTNTSPTVHILGNLSGIDSRCQLISNKLQCNLGSIMKNKAKSFTFNFAFPVSTKVLELKATGSTTSSEPNTANNMSAIVPALAYPSNQITSANVLVSLCTGRGLTSYFECELYPSSISQFTATLNVGGTMTLPEPGYVGQWDQFTSTQQLHFIITDGNGFSAEFNGFAINSTCFEGITTFIPDNGYNSAYKVCVQ